MNSPSARRRPGRDEYFEFYDRYVRLVPDGDIIGILKEQLDSMVEFVAAIPAAKVDYRYEPDKWSVKQVIGHVIDVEWVFTYRGLRFARGDRTKLPGIDQDALVAGANFAERRIDDLVEEFRHLRAANIVLFDSFSEPLLQRMGTASGCDFSVRSIPYIIAGHAIHHRQVLEDRYLQSH